jgi:hypothetical protein
VWFFRPLLRSPFDGRGRYSWPNRYDQIFDAVRAGILHDLLSAWESQLNLLLSYAFTLEAESSGIYVRRMYPKSHRGDAEDRSSILGRDWLGQQEKLAFYH